MKYLQTFETFASQSNPELSVAVGDLVNIDLDGDQKIAKITKKISDNTYIINIVNDQETIGQSIKIDSSQIISMAKSVEEPAMNNDIVTQQTTKVSNDMVINSGSGLRT